MSQNRRQFLLTVAGANSLAYRTAQAQRVEKSASALQRPLDVALFLDEEDTFSPPELGNDDTVKELATILSEEGLRATFLFVGERARLLKERRRQDVIDSLESHDIGSHMLTVRHPTGPELVAGRDW